ncbi:MAG TPA: DUF4342 domain-containing protein [Clostridiaceae bacterium]|nr:DUF4342 domain-containing protein [Clostridiaceae bacterium]
MITTEQIDAFMSQTGASYDTAKHYLKETDGDVDAALQKYRDDQSGKHAYTAQDFIQAIKEIVSKGNATSLRIENVEGKTVLNLSLTISALGVVLVPYLSLIGLGALALTDYSFYVDKADGTVINVHDWLLGKKKRQDEADDGKAPSGDKPPEGGHDYY